MEDQGYREYRFQALLDENVGPCAASVRFHRWDSSSLSIDLTWLGEESQRRLASGYLSQLTSDHLRLKSLSTKSDVRIFGIEKIETDLDKAKVFARDVEIGIGEEEFEEVSRYSVFVRLQPSGILSAGGIVEKDFKVGFKRRRYLNEPIEFDTKLGKFEATDNFEYQNSQSHGNQVTEVIRRATLLGKIEISIGESLDGVHEQLVKGT